MVAHRLSGLRRRPGFTLIELSVVIGLLLVLAAIAIMFLPSFQDQDKAGLGSRQLSGMLQMLKTQAMRDQRIRGVRLLPPPMPNPAPAFPFTSLYWISEVQPIEQPDEFSIGQLTSVLTKANSSIVTFDASVDFSGGFGTDQTLWPVQVGDYLQLNGGGLMWRITLVTPPNQLTLDMVNTMVLNPAQTAVPPGVVTARVQNRANILNSMSLTIDTGNSEEVVQATSVTGTQLTFNTTLPHTPPYAVRSSPPFPVASSVSFLGKPFPNPPPKTPAVLNPGYNQTIQPAAKGGAAAQEMQGVLAGTQLVLDAGVSNKQEIVTVGQVQGEIIQLDYVQFSHGPTFTVQTLDAAAPMTVPPISPPSVSYRIMRAPRVAGEDKLTLPTNIAIDLNAKAAPDANYNLCPPAVPGLPPVLPPIDLLFSPSGSVVGPLAGYDKIILWVRDVSLPNVTDNVPVLVCIYTRSGAIVPHLVDPLGGNGVNSYYSFTVDGRPTEGQ
jgi:prepilin-type N-terminal cleavage/methylation domain-containing protein